MKKKSFLILLSCFMITSAWACTSAIVSGNVTEDGRPLLWKHRDTGSLENQLLFIESDGYDFIGVVNAKDTSIESVWMGVNETGFSIMNTASYNINTDTICNVEDDQEGMFMRRALETCATVDDFESLLKDGSGMWGIAANFGVIDAAGGAAYFEAGYYEYVKFDVNDAETAPGGYLIRTNFSVTGDTVNGQGYIRYAETNRLFSNAEKLDMDFLLTKAARHLGHGAVKHDIDNMKRPRCFKDTTLTAFQDYIVRYWSASDLIVKGIRPGEDPDQIVLYPIMGFSLTTPVTPLRYGFKDRLPSIVMNSSTEAPALARASLALKKRCFPLTHDDHENYIDVSRLKNRMRTGTLDKLPGFEKRILQKFNDLPADADDEQIRDYVQWTDRFVMEFYKGYGIAY